jgi:hypothetical protein
MSHLQEATQLTLSQRRFLDRGESKLPWQEKVPEKPLKSGKYTTLSINKREYTTLLPTQRHGGALPPRSQSSCTCPRCHMPQSHNGHRGSHLCASCGLMLHQKKVQILQRRKGRGLERAL